MGVINWEFFLCVANWEFCRIIVCLLFYGKTILFVVVKQTFCCELYITVISAAWDDVNVC